MAFEEPITKFDSSPIPGPDVSHLSSSLTCVGLELNASDIKEIVSDEFGYPANAQAE